MYVCMYVCISDVHSYFCNLFLVELSHKIWHNCNYSQAFSVYIQCQNLTIIPVYINYNYCVKYKYFYTSHVHVHVLPSWLKEKNA